MPKYLIFDFDGVLGDTWNHLIEFHMQLENISRFVAEEKMTDYFLTPKHTKTSNFSQAN